MLKRSSHLQSVLSDDLPKNNKCYVLITCGEPTKDGQMQVEMIYGGDRVLAAYLLESASTIMETQYDTSLT